MKPSRQLTTLLASGALLLGACSSTPHAVKSEELAPGATGKTYDELLVVGVYDDRTFRVASETAFVDELRGHDVDAVASYDVIPRLSSLDSDADIRALTEDQDSDGILTISTIDAGYDYDYGQTLQTRGMVYLLGSEPGAGSALGSFITWAGSGSYKLHVALWDADTLQPVWQVTTSSQSTGSDTGDLRALVDFVVERLDEQGLL